MISSHNAQVIQGLEPSKVFYYFATIASIPHGSGNERALSRYIYELAQEKHWEAYLDDYNNVVIKKPASPGYEDTPALLMQAHLDMVCVKDDGVLHDFLTDPLELRRVGDFLYASGTSLGADNGIGVALLLAILDTPELRHPPLEVLLTADEEAGMSGIRNFDGSRITAKHLLNMDSKMDSLTVACAGGQRFTFHIPYRIVPSDAAKSVCICLDGLKGGHSGAEIGKNRGNACKLMARVLYDIMDSAQVELVSFTADGKANAIPSSAKAVVNVKGDLDLDEKLAHWQRVFRQELAHEDDSVSLSLLSAESSHCALCKADAQRLLRCVLLTPCGALRREPSGEVVYSNNLGAISFGKETIDIFCLARSSLESLLQTEYLPQMFSIADALMIDGKQGGGFPCWEYVEDSPLRELCKETYFELNKVYPEIISRHAGSECGHIMEKCPSLTDAVATGSKLYNMHTTDEHLDIPAVSTELRFLCNILENFKNLQKSDK